jgi:hypothetical protein
MSQYGTTYGRLVGMRPVPFQPRHVLWSALLLTLPALPVALTTVPFFEIAKRVLRLFSGKLGA